MSWVGLKEASSVGLVLGAGFAVLGCDFGAIKKCHDEMGASQQMMLDFSNGDREDLATAQKTLAAVERTLSACREAKRTEEVEKITDAHQKLVAHVKSLEERAEREKRPKLTAEELAELKAKGDRSCPKGQEYEHYQNSQVIKCTGPQMYEMTPEDVTEYFKRRGFKKTEAGKRLSFERGAQVLEFDYAALSAGALPECVTIIADPGIPWQETVTRATGVQPMRLKLGKPVTTPKGPRELLVEGGPEQYTVKLGKCAPTPGQKALVEEVKAE